MDLSKLKDDRVVAEWPFVQADAGEKAVLRVDVGDWSLANEIRAEIYLPGGVDGLIVCSLTNKTPAKCQHLGVS